MRRWIVAPVAFTAAVLALCSSGDVPAAFAQDKTQEKPAANKKAYPEPEVESVTTADGVKLRVLFHPSKDPKAKQHKDQVVILMYPPGPGRDMTTGDWAGLANRLNEEGYHVFRFDWRGHGGSTEIADQKMFWNNGPTAHQNNTYITGAKKTPPKVTIKDFTANALAKYYPVFVNDLAAVRLMVDKRNDSGDVNSSSVYLVGAGEATSIGMLWMTAEWLRPATNPPQGALGINVARYAYVPQPLTAGALATEAGTTLAGAVWLSAVRPANTALLNETVTKNWVSRVAPKVRETPMLFLYGDKDSRASQQAKWFYNEVLVAGGRGTAVDKLELTFEKPIATAQTGVNLLGNNAELKTEDRMIDYLTVIQKRRMNIGRVERGWKDVPYYIDLKYFIGQNP